MCQSIDQSENKLFLAVASAASRLEMAMVFAIIIISSEKSRIGIEATIAQVIMVLIIEVALV